MSEETKEFRQYWEYIDLQTRRVLEEEFKRREKEQAQYILKNYIENNWDPDCDELIEYLNKLSKK